MRIEEARKRCAEFMGAAGELGLEGNKYLLFPDNSSPWVKDYLPDTNIQQANELWKKLEDNGYDVIFSKASYCVLMHKDIYIVGEGKWWPEALTFAVAEL